METTTMSTDEVVEHVMRIKKSLPTRPGIDEVEAAKMLVKNVEKERIIRLESISKQNKNKDVPEGLFKIFQEMQKESVEFEFKEQKREAVKLFDLENAHSRVDEMIQRASKCLSLNSSSVPPRNSSSLSLVNSSSFSGSNFNSPGKGMNSMANSLSFFSEKENVKVSELVTRDDSYLKKAKTTFQMDGVGGDARIVDSTLKPSIGQDGEKLSLIKLASLVEVSAIKGTTKLILQRKLSDQVEWIPDSIGKLSSLVNLDLSENRIVVLPTTIGSLSSLQRLDLHGNSIIELADSVGDLLNLVYLDLSGNSLKSLSLSLARLSRLEELDLSSNMLSVLPETVGSLVSLRKLIVQTNDLEELPHTIGQCTSLKELRADYNRIKVLPEAVGRIGSLELLSVRYNNIKQLPTTMASLTSLKELNVSFNELESVPESLCFATTLVKLNISNNFADLRSLPRSIGNLEMLEELDISNNQIRILPDSFRMLLHLLVLRTEGNPLEVPPGNIAETGARAVVQYMADLVDKRDAKPQPVKQKKTWAQICFLSRSN